MENLFEEALFERVAQTGDLSPGNLNFAADIVGICARHMEGWTPEYDNVVPPCDVLGDAADYLRTKARGVGA